MARIKETSVRETVEAADMVEVVQARTQLRRSGARWTGLCPFHDEKTPSFSVNPADKFFYCFGCGKGGDVITFVRETEQLDFVQAVEWLAERFRVALEYEETSPEQDAARGRRERLLALLEQATALFAQDLRALLGGFGAPAGQGAVRRLDRLAGLLGTHPRDGAQALAGRRVGDRDRAAVQRVDPLAIDIALLAEQLRILQFHRAPPSTR